MPSVTTSRSVSPTAGSNANNAPSSRASLQPTPEKTVSSSSSVVTTIKNGPTTSMFRTMTNQSAATASLPLGRTKSLQRGTVVPSFLNRTMTGESDMSYVNAMAKELLERSRSEQPDLAERTRERSEMFNEEHDLLAVLHAPDDFPVRYRSSAYPKECSVRKSSGCMSLKRGDSKTETAPETASPRETVGRFTRNDDEEIASDLKRAESAVVSEPEAARSDCCSSSNTSSRNKKSVVVLRADNVGFESADSIDTSSVGASSGGGSNNSVAATVSSAGNTTTNIVLPSGMNALNGTIVLVDANGNQIGTVTMNDVNLSNSKTTSQQSMSMPTGDAVPTMAAGGSSSSASFPARGPLATHQSTCSSGSFQSQPSVMGSLNTGNLMQLQPLGQTSFVAGPGSFMSAGSIMLPRDTNTMNFNSANASLRVSSANNMATNILTQDATARLSCTVGGQMVGGCSFQANGTNLSAMGNNTSPFLQSSTAGGNTSSSSAFSPMEQTPMGNTPSTVQSMNNSVCTTPMSNTTRSPHGFGTPTRSPHGFGTPSFASNNHFGLSTPVNGGLSSFGHLSPMPISGNDSPKSNTPLHRPSYSTFGMPNTLPAFAPVPGTQPVIHNAPEQLETWMLRNIPCRFDQNEVMQILDSVGLEGRYNFFYLPIDIKKTAFRPKKSNANNKGYAFINLKNAKDSDLLFQICHEQRFWDGHWKSNSRKNCQVKPAKNQGFVANVMFYKTEVLDKGAYNCRTGQNSMRKGSGSPYNNNSSDYSTEVEGDRVQKMLQDVAQTPYIEYPVENFRNSDEYVLAIAAQVEGSGNGCSLAGECWN